MTPEGMKPDPFGIWSEQDQVQPRDWLEATAALRAPPVEIESEPESQRESIWWRVSVVTLTASLLGFTVGAGVGRIRQPEVESPWQQLFLEQAIQAPRVTQAAKKETTKKAQPTKKSRSIKLASTAKRAKPSRVKGIVIRRATTASYAPVASGAATTVVRRPTSRVTLIKRPSKSGSDSPGRVNNPARPPAPQPTPSASPSSAPPQEEPDNDFDERRSRSSSRDDDPDPAPTPDDDGEEEPDGAEEPSEQENDGPGNSENAPGHNKDKGPKD